MLLVVAMENFDVSSSRRALASSGNLDVFPLQSMVWWVLVEGIINPLPLLGESGNRFATHVREVDVRGIN
jgi:hypothetical protein